jgi:hypothetical protein
MPRIRASARAKEVSVRLGSGDGQTIPVRDGVKVGHL